MIDFGCAALQVAGKERFGAVGGQSSLQQPGGLGAVGKELTGCAVCATPVAEADGGARLQLRQELD